MKLYGLDEMFRQSKSAPTKCERFAARSVAIIEVASLILLPVIIVVNLFCSDQVVGMVMSVCQTVWLILACIVLIAGILLFFQKMIARRRARLGDKE